jgi:hypothetical protein
MHNQLHNGANMNSQAFCSHDLDETRDAKSSAAVFGTIDVDQLAFVSGGGVSDVLNKVGNDAQNGAGIGVLVGAGTGALVGGLASGGVGAIPGALAGGENGLLIGGAAGALWGLGRGIKDEIVRGTHKTHKK